MQFSTLVERHGGEVVEAELACSLQEENTSQKESYIADWSSICIRTQPQDRQSQDMKDVLRRESMSRQWRLRTLSQTCPSGVFRLGSVERGVREHRLLPTRNTLPLPIFTPAELGVRLGRGAAQEEDEGVGPRSFSPVLDGSCPTKRSLEDITRDLPPVKPTRMEFTKATKALGRSVSQEVQRG
ncbi:hypothetical protein CRUP_029133 [Coryphaenoides rupestris]|nr:hypothetical protein CRUP_029133 [Coryphaenoides rupestris]